MNECNNFLNFLREGFMDNKHCGKCNKFTDETTNGNGWCNYFDKAKNCSDGENCNQYDEFIYTSEMKKADKEAKKFYDAHLKHMK